MEQEKTVPIAISGKYTFRIDAEPLKYTFAIRGEHETEFTTIGELASSLLVRTRPFDSIFTGTHLAIYATGAHCESSLRPAYFENPSWRAVREGAE